MFLTESSPQRLHHLQQRALRQRIWVYFPTPPNLALRLAHLLTPQPGEAVLDPSGGSGELLDAVRAICPTVGCEAAERAPVLAALLRGKGYPVLADDMYTLRQIGRRWPRIIANPSFHECEDARQTIEAVEQLLLPGGRYVGIVSPGTLYRDDARSQSFWAWLRRWRAQTFDLPANAFFTGVRPVAVRTCCVIIDRPAKMHVAMGEMT